MSSESDESTGKRPEIPDRLDDEKTIGEILLAARERNGMTLDDVSQETKIPKRMLEYLETDNFEALPAKVYVKGFLRSYAEVLSLDVDHILSKYEVQTGQTHKSKGDLWEIETVTMEEQLESPKIFTRFVLPALVIAAAIIVFVVVIGRDETERQPAQTVVEEKEEAPPPEPVPEVIEAVAQEPAEPETMILTVIENPSDSCWFELLAVSFEDGVLDADTFMFLLLPGHIRTFEANEAFVFQKVGNPGSFALELNGSRIELSGERGRVMSDITVTKEDIP